MEVWPDGVQRCIQVSQQGVVGRSYHEIKRILVFLSISKSEVSKNWTGLTSHHLRAINPEFSLVLVIVKNVQSWENSALLAIS